MNDGWVKSAMSNDSLVASLLIRLRHDTRPFRPPPLDERRSNSRKRPAAGGDKKAEPTRMDPTSPGGAVGFYDGEGCTRSAKPAADSSRPKVGDQSGTPITGRRSKRKKKDHSSSNPTPKKHKVTNESSKKWKQPSPPLNLTVEKHGSANETSKRKVTIKILGPNSHPSQTVKNGESLSTTNNVSSAKQKQSSSIQGPLFVVPDLNL